MTKKKTPALKPLRLTSPHTKGPSVAHLQRAINRRLKARKIPGVKADGEYGLETSRAVRLCGLMLGLSEHALEHGATVYVQKRILNPKNRKPSEVKLAKKRLEEYRKAQRAKGGDAGKVIKACKAQIGVHEVPHGSNRGPKITDWERDFGAEFVGASWCGMFVGYFLRHVGNVPVNARVAFTPFIKADAQAGHNSFEGWYPWSKRKPGDLILFNFSGGGTPQHVGILDTDRSHTIEGNTSGTDPTNGGMVARMQRSPGVILGCARPRYPR